MADLSARYSDESSILSSADDTSSSNEESMRAQQQILTLENTDRAVEINGTSNRPTTNPSQSLMTSQRATPTSVTSQGSNTSQSMSQGADAVRMLDGK